MTKFKNLLFSSITRQISPKWELLGSRPFPREDNHEIAKILKSSKGPLNKFQQNMTQKQFWANELQVSSNVECQTRLQIEIIAKIHEPILKFYGPHVIFYVNLLSVTGWRK